MNEQPDNMQDDQNTQGAPSVPQNPNIVNEENQFDRERIEESVKARIRKERVKAEEAQKEAEAVRKELDELKKKFETGKATSNETDTYISTENKIDESLRQGIPYEALPEIIDHHIKLTKMGQQLDEAMEKDPELKALFNDPSSPKKISREELESFIDLPNPAAVFKHLLKNDNDRKLLKAAEVSYVNGDGGFKYFEFLNNLSDKLKDTASYPHPSNFKPNASLTDTGEAETFDSESYIKSKYGASGRK